MNRIIDMEITWRVISKEGERREWEKGTGNKKRKWQVQNRQGEVKNGIGNGEAKELICMTQGHELSGGRGNASGRGCTRWRGIKGRKKWDNCNGIINKNISKNEKKNKPCICPLLCFHTLTYRLSTVLID